MRITSFDQIQRRLQVQGEALGSSLGQPLDNARSHVRPRFAARLTTHYAARSSFNFSGPCRLNFCGIFWRRFIKAGKEFGRDIGALLDRQGQRFSKKFLRSRGHTPF